MNSTPRSIVPLAMFKYKRLQLGIKEEKEGKEEKKKKEEEKKFSHTRRDRTDGPIAGSTRGPKKYTTATGGCDQSGRKCVSVAAALRLSVRAKQGP